MRAAAARVPCIVVLGLLLLVAVSAARAQDTRETFIERANRATVTVITGDLYSTSALMAEDFGSIYNQGEDRRLLPLLGINSAQNVSDTLHLRGVDVAFVHADTLERLRQSGKFTNIQGRLRYIAQLSLDKIIIVAGRAFPDIASLAGKPVNLGPGDPADATPSLLLAALGVKVAPVTIDHRLAIERIRKGELAATVLVGTDLRKLLADVPSSNDLQLLPIEPDVPPVPYVPIVLNGSQLPGLVKPDTNLKTVAVPLVLVTNNWPPGHQRFERVRDFVNTLFARLEELQQPPYAAEWRDVNLAAELPNWRRFGPAEEALADRQPDGGQVSALRASFDQFVAGGGTDLASLTEEQRRKLFEQFLRWPENTVSTKVVMRLTNADGTGAPLGTLELANTKLSAAGRTENALLIRPQLKGMKPGTYAFHVHENPDCGPKLEDGVMVPGLAAGSDLWLSGTGQDQGQQAAGQPGDLPDIVVGDDQILASDMIVGGLSLADVFERSIVIHASDDDNSPRMACGIVR